MRPDQVYLIVNEFELSDPLLICLEIPEVSDMSVARLRPPVCLPLRIIVAGEAHATVARVSQIPQLVNVEGVLLIRGQPGQPPRYHCLCRCILLCRLPGLREADVALGAVLGGVGLHEADGGLREGTQVEGGEEDHIFCVGIQVRLMQVR
jgi:hypothetical protein